MTFLVLVSILALDARSALAHGSHGGGSTGVAHAGAGIAAIRSDDTLKLSVDLFGYLGGSVASGWRTGEPLGAGGKLPLFYNQALHREGPFERAGLAQKDYWPQYRDFSYNPLWLPSQLGVRAQYRFLPTVQGTVTTVYFGSLDRPTLEPNPIELEELFVRWSPANVPGLSLAAGRLFLVGSYSPPFDQFPLESFQINGVAVAYARPLGSVTGRTQLVAGRAPLGRTTAVERIDSDPSRDPPFLDGARARTHLYGTAGVETGGGLRFGVLGGYQVLPADQTTTNEFAPITQRWPQTSGWQAGIEAGTTWGSFDQQVVLSHGRGDVEMAWSAPDYVYVDVPALQQNRLLRRGSTLSQLVYWASAGAGRGRLSGGAWGQWRRPAAVPHTWNIYDEVSQQPMNVDLVPQPFRAAKFNLQPSYTAGRFTFGLRLDSIHYLDKKATTNTIERLTDQALRPQFIPGDSEVIETPRLGPSYWEREAVDSLVVSPMVDLHLGETLRLRGAWSGALYSHAVHRQRRIGRFHANVTLSVLLVYRFARAADEPDHDHDQQPDHDH